MFLRVEIQLEVNDQHSAVNFMLSDKSVINQPPALKQLPDFQVKIKVDRQFINRFISGKGARVKQKLLLF